MPRMASSSPLPNAQSVGVRLADLIERYLGASGGYGKPAALAALGLSHAETESSLSQFDEDYMISRFLHFSMQSGEAFQINGFPQTHLIIDAAIQSIV
jgi:hypothetical protein